MSDKLKEIDIKNHTYYFFDDMTNINKIKIDGKSHKNILINNIGCVMVENISNIKISSVNPLYLIFDKINGYTEESNGDKYLTLVTTDESKNTLKKYQELRNKIKNLIRSITNYSDN